MKITKTQLKQIIMEELSSLSEKRVEEDPKAALEDIYFESEFSKTSTRFQILKSSPRVGILSDV